MIYTLLISVAALHTPAALQDHGADQAPPVPKVEASAVAPQGETAPATVETAKPAVKIKDKSHPDYVRCRSEPVIGSRAKRKRTCMTNRDWALAERRTNEASQDFMGDQFAAGYNN